MNHSGNLTGSPLPEVKELRMYNKNFTIVTPKDKRMKKVWLLHQWPGSFIMKLLVLESVTESAGLQGDGGDDKLISDTDQTGSAALLW